MSGSLPSPSPRRNGSGQLADPMATQLLLGLPDRTECSAQAEARSTVPIDLFLDRAHTMTSVTQTALPPCANAPIALMTAAAGDDWRPVPGYDGHYEASAAGQIRSRSRRVSLKNGRTRWAAGRVLRPGPINGYEIVILRGRSRLVHRLVALTFHGSAPFPDAVVMHLDDNKRNNAAANLRWGTRVENSRDAVPRTLEGRRRGLQQERPQTMSTQETLDDLPREQWAPWPVHPAILVSTLGRVSRPRKGVRRLLRPAISQGYLRYGLSINGRLQSVLGHRLVMQTFRAAAQRETDVCVRHLNDHKADNRLANLRWGTCAENAADSAHVGSHVRVSPLLVRTLWKESATHTASQLAARYSLPADLVRSIAAGETWTHLTGGAQPARRRGHWSPTERRVRVTSAVLRAILHDPRRAHALATAYNVSRAIVERVKRQGVVAVTAAIQREAVAATKAAERAVRHATVAAKAAARAALIPPVPAAARLEALIRAVRCSPLGVASAADAFHVSTASVHNFRRGRYAARFPFTEAEDKAGVCRRANLQATVGAHAPAIARALAGRASIETCGEAVPASAAAGIADTSAQSSAPDSQEQLVRTIRRSLETNPAVAARLGMSTMNVKAIRTGRSHARYAFSDEERRIQAWRSAHRSNRARMNAPTGFDPDTAL